MKTLNRFAPHDQKHSFKAIKAQLNMLGERPPFAIAIGTDGAEVPYTPKQICDIFFNGMIFHADPELQIDLARILEFEPFVMGTFLQYACSVVNVATRCAGYIKFHKFVEGEMPLK
jgi:hypothetical protein